MRWSAQRKGVPLTGPYAVARAVSSLKQAIG